MTLRERINKKAMQKEMDNDGLTIVIGRNYVYETYFGTRWYTRPETVKEIKTKLNGTGEYSRKTYQEFLNEK